MRCLWFLRGWPFGLLGLGRRVHGHRLHVGVPPRPAGVRRDAARALAVAGGLAVAAALPHDGDHTCAARQGIVGCCSLGASRSNIPSQSVPALGRRGADRTLRLTLQGIWEGGPVARSVDILSDATFGRTWVSSGQANASARSPLKAHAFASFWRRDGLVMGSVARERTMAPDMSCRVAPIALGGLYLLGVRSVIADIWRPHYACPNEESLLSGDAGFRRPLPLDRHRRPWRPVSASPPSCRPSPRASSQACAGRRRCKTPSGSLRTTGR